MGLQEQNVTIGKETFTHYFLCHYVPKAVGSDKLSKSLLRFKRGWPEKQAWIECSVLELKKIPNLEALVIFRALHSFETSIPKNSSTSLDDLGWTASQTLPGRYQPDCLYKGRSTEALKYLSREERKAALHDAYNFNVPDPPPANILILDDIYTTGTTMQAIVSTIREILPSSIIRFFTLACTGYDSYPNREITLKSYPYEWEQEKGWLMAEEEPGDYEDDLATQATNYKGFILIDSALLHQEHIQPFFPTSRQIARFKMRVKGGDSK